jgi:hypothetical protein
MGFNTGIPGVGQRKCAASGCCVMLQFKLFVPRRVITGDSSPTCKIRIFAITMDQCRKHHIEP